MRLPAPGGRSAVWVRRSKKDSQPCVIAAIAAHRQQQQAAGLLVGLRDDSSTMVVGALHIAVSRPFARPPARPAKASARPWPFRLPARSARLLQFLHHPERPRPSQHRLDQLQQRHELYLRDPRRRRPDGMPAAGPHHTFGPRGAHRGGVAGAEVRRSVQRRDGTMRLCWPVGSACTVGEPRLV